jgi:hypothetical protein
LKKQFVSLKLLTFILLLCFLFQITPALAQNELTDAQTQERLQAIRHMLEQGKPNANRWWYGWLIGYSAATIGQGAVYLSSEDRDLRQDMALGAATTFLGAAGQLIAPTVPGTAPDRLAQFSENTPEERSIKLLKAEELLRKSALQEKFGRSWKTHAITGAVNLSSGLVVWLGFKRSFLEGVGNFALNTVITEAQIWSQPTRAIADYDDYFNNYKASEKLGSQKSATSWSVTLSPGRVGISILF